MISKEAFVKWYHWFHEHHAIQSPADAIARMETFDLEQHTFARFAKHMWAHLKKFCSVHVESVDGLVLQVSNADLIYALECLKHSEKPDPDLKCENGYHAFIGHSPMGQKGGIDQIILPRAKCICGEETFSAMSPIFVAVKTERREK